MLTSFFNEPDDFEIELKKCVESGSIERNQIHVTSSRRFSEDIGLSTIVFICTFVSSDLLHHLEVFCGRVRAEEFATQNGEVMEELNALDKRFRNLAKSEELEVSGGLLEVRIKVS